MVVNMFKFPPKLDAATTCENASLDPLEIADVAWTTVVRGGHPIAILVFSTVCTCLVVLLGSLALRTTRIMTHVVCFTASVAFSRVLQESLLASELVADTEVLLRYIAVYCTLLFLALEGVVALGGLISLPLPPTQLASLSSTSGVGVPLPYNTCKVCAYLDYNGTTPIFPEVSREMLPYITSCFGNPSSNHIYGQEAKLAVDKARNQVAKLINCSPSEIFFTSCGTESNNWAIKIATFKYLYPPTQSQTSTTNGESHGTSSNSRRKGHVITSAIEHPAIIECLKTYEARGDIELTVVGVTSEGLVEVEAVRKAFRPNTVLVTIMHSNNEVGSIQPIEAIADICAESSTVLFHSDAAQSIGKAKIDVKKLHVDMLTLVGHKFGAPKGVAALYIKASIGPTESFLYGGGQENGKRAGTESTALIVGLGKAAELATVEFEHTVHHMRTMRDTLQQRLISNLSKSKQLDGNMSPMIGAINTNTGGAGALFQVHGPTDDGLRLPNTLSIAFRGLLAPVILGKASGLAASAGAACHSHPGPKHKSHTSSTSSANTNINTTTNYAKSYSNSTHGSNSGSFDICNTDTSNTSGGELSAVLKAMGVDRNFGLGTVRLSVGRHTTLEEVERAAAILASVVKGEFRDE